ncbi:hypothetical protein AGDE_15555 [Angomonas deanei]|nr:hypothetical protein AGDE_15555 [Angomonas deanei]|eukprot:EPY18862.1 hypothetical protein AGDE_15555 [Angomonas deanei]
MGEVPLPPRELLPDFILAAKDANDQQGELVNTQDSNRTTDYNQSNTVHSNGSHDAKLLSSTSSWSAASFMDQQRQWKFHYERFLTSLLQRGISLANDAYDVLPVIKEEVRNMKSDLQGRCGAWLLSLLELRCACLLSTVAQIVNRGGPTEKIAEECSGALRLCARTAVKVIHSIDHVLPSLETLQEQEHTSGVSIRMIQFILLSLQLRCLRHLSLVTMVCGAVYLEETLFTAYSVLELATSTTEQCVVRLSGPACQQWSADLQGEVLMVSLSVLELLLTQSPQHYSERRCQLMGMVVSLLKRWRDHTRECRFPNCAEEVVLRLRKEVPTDFHAILDHLQRQTVSVVRGEAGRREKSVFHGYTITQLWSAAGVDLHFTKTKCLLHTLITLKPFFPADGMQTEQ